MKVVVSHISKEGYDRLDIKLNSSFSFTVHSDVSEPEDNLLYRNFEDCFDIPTMLRKAYEAGKAGEEFEVVHIEDTEEE